NPVLVAEQIGTLASIARGRFIMQCGLGYGEAQFAAMGASIKTRPSAFEESLDIVRRLLAGETVSSSQRFTLTKASIAPRPPEVAERFRTFGEFGYTDVIVRHLTNDQPKVLASLARLEKVRAALH